jgi:protoheme IX farnesyltransferase
MDARIGIEGMNKTARLPGAVNRIKAYIALTKPRIIELLLITTVPTMFVAAKHLPSAGLIGLTLVGGSLAAGGANAFNMIYDRDIDAVMNRTKHRPLVTGVVTPRAALVFACVLEVLAFIELWTTVNLLSAALALSATAFYVGVYTMWLKRSSPQNIVIGGAAGAVPVLVGWSAVTDHLGVTPFLLFGIIFLWTPPHFWALSIRYRDDYAHANVPMLTVTADIRSVVRQMILYTAALLVLSVALAPIAHLGPVYFSIAMVLGIAFLVQAWALRRDPSPRRAMKLFGFSITYLTVLFLSMGVTAIALHP